MPGGRCRADGCRNEALARNRHVVCAEHADASVLRVSGESLRWCKACKRLEPLENFEGERRTCTTSRTRSRAARRRGTMREERPDVVIRASTGSYFPPSSPTVATYQRSDPLSSQQSTRCASRSGEGSSNPALSSEQPARSSHPHTYALHEQAGDGPHPRLQLPPQLHLQYDQPPFPEEEQCYFSPEFVTCTYQHLSGQRQRGSDEDPPTLEHEAAPKVAASSQQRVEEPHSQPAAQATLENEEAVLHTVAVKIYGYEPHELSSSFRQTLARWLLLRPVCFSTFGTAP